MTSKKSGNKEYHDILKRVRMTAPMWKKPAHLSDEEWAVLPHSQEEWDAITSVTAAQLGTKYHMDNDDCNGLFGTFLYVGWVFYMLATYELPVAGIDYNRIIDDLGISREVLEKMAEIFRVNIVRVNDSCESEEERKESEKINQLYGYEIDDAE